MKATHLFHGAYPVHAVDVPDRPHLARITYIGPTVPGNRRAGEVRLASRIDFNGKPTLVPLPDSPDA